MRTINNFGLLLLALVAGLGAGWSHAQSYPSRPVHIYTGLPGATADVVTRLVATEISVPLGQAVVVENRPAGPGLASIVAKAAPDGYSLLLWSGGLWLGPLLEPSPYDYFRDFSPITTITRSPNLLVVNPALPVQSIPDLIKLVKARSGQLNYSSGSNGSSSHLAGELFKSLVNADIVRISYKGGPQEVLDLISGQVHMTFGGGTSMAGQIKAGKLRLLASAGSSRSILFPDLPTVTETLPGFVSEQFYAFFAPAKTPDAIVKRLNQETVRILNKPDVREKLLNQGLEAVGGTPEQLTELTRSEIARMTNVIKAIVANPPKPAP